MAGVAALIATPQVARTRVAVSALLRGEQPADAAREAQQAVRDGFRTVKLKVGVSELSLDEARVAAVREISERKRSEAALREEKQMFTGLLESAFDGVVIHAYGKIKDIKTGECFFCKKAGRTQMSQKTELHHLKYDNSDPLAWTLEICNWCHGQVDVKRQMKIEQSRQRKWNKQTDEHLAKRKRELGF